MKDALGDRIKRQYEDRWRVMLPRRTYTIIRCDGKSFHSYSRQCEKPFDVRLIQSMEVALWRLCMEAQGACLGYHQSDELSVLLTDFGTPQTDAWFDGNAQKVVSVATSIVTEAFNKAAEAMGLTGRAWFDGRVFVIPDPVEVENYFIWRQKDAERNSLSSLAQQHYSPGQLRGKGKAEQHDMLHAKGINWNDLPAHHKRGACAVRTDEAGWFVDQDIPVLMQDREYLRARIPVHDNGR